MITIQIHKHLDSDFIGLHSFFMNNISLGSAVSSNIRLTHNFNSSFRILVNKSKEVFIKTLSPTSHFLYNGKKISGKKLLLKNDLIKIDQIEFSISDYEYTDDFKDRDITSLYSSAIELNPNIEKVFKALEAEVFKQSSS